MIFETKRNLQSLVIWIILMTITYFVHGFTDIGWFLGCAWVCLIVSGILVIIWESLARKQKTSEYDKMWFEGLEAFREGQISYQIRDWSKALDCFNRALECGYVDNVYALRADCLQAAGLTERALEDYTKAISDAPKDCNLYFMRSLSKSRADDIDGAIADLEKAIELSQLDNELNSTYRAGAKKIGWPEGHTSLYRSHLVMEQIKKRHVLKKALHSD